MERLKLFIPQAKNKEEVMLYKEEFKINDDSMDGTAGLQRNISYEDWLKEVKDFMNRETVKEGYVPGTTFLAIREHDKRLVGMINIRHELNDYLMNFGGNIGYSIRKSERRKGYATEMLRLALDKCKVLGLNKVLLTCDKNNIGSAKTMKNNGAVLENEVKEEDRITQRYWIDL